MKIETKRMLALAVLTVLAACSPKGEELYARAEAALAKGDANAAVIDLKNLIQAEPQNAKARALLGKAFVATGQLSLAEVELQKARDLGASEGQMLDSACRVLLAKNLFEQVLNDCSPDKGDASQKQDLKVVNATALLALGRTAEAQSAFEKIVAETPDDVEAWLGFASAAARTGGAASFKSTLEKAPSTVKGDVRYWLALGGVNTQEGEYADAVAAFQKAVDITEDKDSRGPTRVGALGGLAEAQMRLGDMQAAQKTADELAKVAPKHPMGKMLRGQIAAINGDFDGARTLLEDAVKDMPNNAEALILLSSVKIRLGQLDQAEENLKTVVANNPQNARAQRMLLDVRAKLGETPTESLSGLQVALKQNPGDATMLAEAGRLSVQSGNREQALTYLAEAEKATGKDDAEAQLNIANGYLAAGEVDRAIEVLNAMPSDGATSGTRDALLLFTLMRKGDTNRLMSEASAVLARSGKDAATRNVVGSVYAASGKPDLAREQFNEALKLKPNDTAALTNLARLDFASGDLAKAEANLKKVLAVDPRNLVAVMGLALSAQKRNDPGAAEKYLAQAVKDHPDSVEAQVALMRHYMDAKKNDKAKAVADAMVDANPRNAEAANARGVMMVSIGDVPAAISSFERARTLQPESFQIVGNLARAQMLNKDSKGALDTLDAALVVKPKSAELLALAASLSLQSQNLERATGYVERLRQVAPGLAATAQIEGDLAMTRKQYTQALAAYEKADPQRQNRQITIARYAAAIRAKAPQPELVLEQWVAAHPDDIEVIAMLGEAKRSKGDVDGAMRLYQQGLEKAPQSAVLNNNLAMIYIEKGDPRAVATAEKAWKALPKAAAIQDTYGWALLKAGKTEQAVSVLADAARGAPSNAEVQYHYAAALAKAGRKDEARAAVAKAVAGTLPPSLKADAERLAKELK